MKDSKDDAYSAGESSESLETLSTGMLVCMIFLALTVPVWLVFQMFLLTVEGVPSTVFWLFVRVGWLYLPAVVVGFMRALRRRPSEGDQCLTLLLPPAVVVGCLVLLLALEGLMGKG